LKKKATILSKQEGKRGVTGVINVCSNQLPVRPPGKESDDGYNNSIVHFITRNNKVRKSSGKEASCYRRWNVALIGRYCMKRLGVSPLKLIVHHSINKERSIPADRRVHNVPLDDTLMVVADDFSLLVLALAQALGPAPDPLLELLATVSCREISENMNKERVCGGAHPQDDAWPRLRWWPG
jgi:hypothetical protein